LIYTLDFEIGSNTSEPGRITDNIYLVRGLIYKIEFKFPPGCAGLAHVCINQGVSQIWPSTSGNYFASDNETISFDDLFEITSEPAQLEAYGYNEDTANKHTIYIRIGLVDKWEYQARFLPTIITKMRKLEEEQEEAQYKEVAPKIELILPFRANREL